MDDAWINLFVQNCTRLMARLNNSQRDRGLPGMRPSLSPTTANSVRHSGGQSRHSPTLAHSQSSSSSSSSGHNLQYNSHRSDPGQLNTDLYPDSASSSSSSSSIQSSSSSENNFLSSTSDVLQDGNRLSTIIRQQHQDGPKFYYDENGVVQALAPFAAHQQDHILQSHSESARNALIYVAVILSIYLLAVACIAIQYYRKHSTLNPFNSYLCRRGNASCSSKDYYRSSLTSTNQSLTANTGRRKRKSSAAGCGPSAAANPNNFNFNQTNNNNNNSSSLKQLDSNPATTIPNTPSSSCLQNGNSNGTSFESGPVSGSAGGGDVDGTAIDGVAIDEITSCCAAIVKHKSSLDSRQPKSQQQLLKKYSDSGTTIDIVKRQSIVAKDSVDEKPQQQQVNIRINIESVVDSDEIITQIDDDEDFSPDYGEDDEEEEDIDDDDEDDEGYEYEESDEMPVLELDIEKNETGQLTNSQLSRPFSSCLKSQESSTSSGSGGGLLSNKKNQLKRLFTHFSTSSSSSTNSTGIIQNQSTTTTTNKSYDSTTINKLATKPPTTGQSSLPLIGANQSGTSSSLQSTTSNDDCKLIARSVSFQTPEVRFSAIQCQSELTNSVNSGNHQGLAESSAANSANFKRSSLGGHFNGNSISGECGSGGGIGGAGTMALFKATPRMYEETHL